MVESQTSNDDEKETTMSVTALVGPSVNPTESAPLPVQRIEAPEPPSLQPGTRVQVRRKFDDKWATGFEVAEATTQGYKVRRLSDGELIPVPIAADDLRKEKKRSNWWY
jgi:hypothetical protein